MPQRALTSAGSAPILEIRDVRKAFKSPGLLGGGRRRVQAVDGVSLSVAEGETVAIVGESGCGKTTLARTVAHLYRPDSGTIRLLGRDVHDLDDSGFRPYRRHVQMVFQNPLGSFDPFYSIGYSIAEVARLRPDEGRLEARIGELLAEVGLSPRFAKLKPRQMSGGEQQRAAIARALAARPELVVMDEPTSALDMSIQGQVLRLMRDLQQRHGVSYLIATHDLRSVRLVAHAVIVMYLGQIVEEGPAEAVLERPSHPYTRGLLNAHDLARRTTEKDDAVRIRGTLKYPDPGYAGCRLVGRCPFEKAKCREPQTLALVGPGHTARCWRVAAGEIGS